MNRTDFSKALHGGLVAETADFLALFHVPLRRGGRSGKADLDQLWTRLLLQHVFAIEFRHTRVFGLLFEPRVASADLFVACGFGYAKAVEIVLNVALNVLEDNRALLARV